MPDNCEMWERIGLNMEGHDQLMQVIPPLVQETFLKQENRPEKMDYFDFVLSDIHGIRVHELQEIKKNGGKVIGTFCVYVPEEIILAAGGTCIGLCTGADVAAGEAEKVLPRNICPLIKSSIGFKMAKICPYFESTDLIIGETTCDGKQKAWEILATMTPTYVMELPSMKRDTSRKLWQEEVKAFKNEVEKTTGKTGSDSDLKAATAKVNGKRRALLRLSDARKADPAPISGKDALLIEQIAFYDDVDRFTAKTNEIAEELEGRVARGDGVFPAGTPRLMISGTPMTVPNWKIPHIIETSGGSVVVEESCTGQRYFRELVDESNSDTMTAIADRYFATDCACFSPNDERIDNILKLAKEYNVDGVVYTSLMFCDPYAVEYIKVKDALDKAGIPVLKIETDYGMEDAGQIRTRVEAFLEQVKEKTPVS
ncbi:MAG: double-cubane-cluster-containing anaerobic reductase [Actinomycetota bacterium]